MRQAVAVASFDWIVQKISDVAAAVELKQQPPVAAIAAGPPASNFRRRARATDAQHEAEPALTETKIEEEKTEKGEQ